MRWNFRDDACGTRSRWEQWPHWFQALAVMGILVLMSPAFAAAYALARNCARIGRPWYQC